MKRPTKTSQSTGKGLYPKGNKGSLLGRSWPTTGWPKATGPSLKLTESLSLHSARALPCHQLHFYQEKNGRRVKGVKDRRGTDYYWRVQQTLPGESWNCFYFLENLNSSFTQVRNLGDIQMPSFSFLFPSNQIGHRFLSFYTLNISHLYTTFQASSLLFAQDQSLLTHVAFPPGCSFQYSRRLQAEGALGNPSLFVSLPLRGSLAFWKALAHTHYTGSLDQSPAYFFRLLLVSPFFTTFT